MSQIIQPTFFLSHGGGPWPWLRKEMPYLDGLHDSLVKTAQNLLARPKAILVVSGHWEEDEFTIMSSPRPPMIYDYGGFPEHTYQIQYPASGAPQLAKQVRDLLSKARISSRFSSQRGFDHGVYSLLYPMFPNADVPIIQVSMKRNYSPIEHFNLGVALSSLRREGVLILGSGNIFHNLKVMGSSQIQSEQFDRWIADVVTGQNLNLRNSTILDWETAPYARHCHPREDHLVPLFFAMGAGSDEHGSLVYRESLIGRVAISCYKFG